jgi:predicted O-linked N-acetylglucosamine transferase (SPINDLY family)
MATGSYTSTVLQAMASTFSVPDLIRTAETLKQSGQINAVETLYETWTQHNQDNPLLYAVLFNYGVTLTDVGKLEAARSIMERAIALNPDFMPAYINLGRIHERFGNIGLAIVQWSTALDRMPAINGQAITYKTTALNQSARALESVNQDGVAESMLRQSLEIDCHQHEVIQHLIALRQRQCEWPVVLPSDRVDHKTLSEGMSPLSAAVYADDPVFQLGIAWNYNRLDVGTPTEHVALSAQATAPSERLRIGYLSSDLREHAVGYLMTEVLGLHDRSKVEVFAYYCGIDAHDPLHEHFKNSVDHWVSISNLDDATAARRIAEDGIQILVDVNGYTRDARLKTLAHRPAPVIINWLGFPGTMASPYHNYIIADDWLVPEASEIYYTEKVLRLPCYQPSNRKRNVAPEPPSRTKAGLPEKGMVYCCFNGAHKINRFTFDRWLTILAGVPGSVLWLLGSNKETDARLKEYAASHGIDRERIIFAEKLANPFHLARYALADLFLDTTPYGAHTTASDALWMGVPVLTLSGRSFASRVCGSLVQAAGIPELVCTAPDEFVNRAIAFGNDPASLQPFREKLQTGRDSCTLFDTPLLVRHLEDLYAQVWEEFQAGKMPRPDLTNLDVYLEVGSQVKHDEMEVQTIENYRDWWVEQLLHRHQFRPIQLDHRLVTDPALFS